MIVITSYSIHYTKLYDYSPGGFAQVNLSQNRNLVAAVMAAVETIRPKRVLDLYCGMGNFSLPLALLAAEVVGIEDHAPSISYNFV